MNVGTHTGILDFKGMAKIATGNFPFEALLPTLNPNVAHPTFHNRRSDSSTWRGGRMDEGGRRWFQDMADRIPPLASEQHTRCSRALNSQVSDNSITTRLVSNWLTGYYQLHFVFYTIVITARSTSIRRLRSTCCWMMKRVLKLLSMNSSRAIIKSRLPRLVNK